MSSEVYFELENVIDPESGVRNYLVQLSYTSDAMNLSGGGITSTVMPYRSYVPLHKRFLIDNLRLEDGPTAPHERPHERPCDDGPLFAW